METPKVKQVLGGCPKNCPDACAWVVTVKDGRAVELRANRDHPFTRGFLCAKVSRYLEQVYSDQRVLHPLRRTGPKGSGEFRRITWDEALDEISRRLQEAASSPEGPESILPLYSGGTMGMVQGWSMGNRFFHRLGASRLDVTICSAAGEAGIAYTMGGTRGMDPEGLKESRLILLWASNTLTSNPHLWPYILEARRRGATVVAIDPVRTRTAAACDWHLPIRPGTDAALALGLMQQLIANGWVDEDYVERYTLGYDRLAARAMEYPPERTAAICGLDAEDVRKLARMYGTMRPTAIRLGWGVQRHGGGGMAVRTISCLPALTGDWRHAGGGLLLSTSQTFPINWEALARPDLQPRPARLINICRLGETLLDRRDPSVKVLFVYDANPAATLPDQNRVIRGLLREDLFTVVHEQFLTDTADYADIVLPATTQLEHTDLVHSYGHLHLTWNEPAISPRGEAVCNTDLFRRLAARLGLTDPALYESDEDLARQALSPGHPMLEGITVERLKAGGFVRLNLPRPYRPYAGGGFDTPSGRCEFYSATMAGAGFDPLPTYTPPAEDPVTSPLAKKYPLTLLAVPAHHFLKSTFANFNQAREKEPVLRIHPVDAASRRIRDGQMVRVRNDRGEFLARAAVTDVVRIGVVVTPVIWWRKYSPGGSSANVTVAERDADLGGGPTYYDNLVEVEAYR